MNAIAELEVTNVSRRAFLRGLAAGTFVLAVRISPPAFAQDKKYGGEAMSGGRDSQPLVQPRRDGPGSPHELGNGCR